MKQLESALTVARNDAGQLRGQLSQMSGELGHAQATGQQLGQRLTLETQRTERAELLSAENQAKFYQLVKEGADLKAQIGGLEERLRNGENIQSDLDDVQMKQAENEKQTANLFAKGEEAGVAKSRLAMETQRTDFEGKLKTASDAVASLQAKLDAGQTDIAGTLKLELSTLRTQSRAELEAERQRGVRAVQAVETKAQTEAQTAAATAREEASKAEAKAKEEASKAEARARTETERVGRETAATQAKTEREMQEAISARKVAAEKAKGLELRATTAETAKRELENLTKDQTAMVNAKHGDAVKLLSEQHGTRIVEIKRGHVEHVKQQLENKTSELLNKHKAEQLQLQNKIKQLEARGEMQKQHDQQTQTRLDGLVKAEQAAQEKHVLLQKQYQEQIKANLEITQQSEAQIAQLRRDVADDQHRFGVSDAQTSAANLELNKQMEQVQREKAALESALSESQSREQVGRTNHNQLAAQHHADSQAAIRKASDAHAQLLKEKNDAIEKIKVQAGAQDQLIQNLHAQVAELRTAAALGDRQAVDKLAELAQLGEDPHVVDQHRKAKAAFQATKITAPLVAPAPALPPPVAPAEKGRPLETTLPPSPTAAAMEPETQADVTGETGRKHKRALEPQETEEARFQREQEEKVQEGKQKVRGKRSKFLSTLDQAFQRVEKTAMADLQKATNVPLTLKPAIDDPSVVTTLMDKFNAEPGVSVDTLVEQIPGLQEAMADPVVKQKVEVAKQRITAVNKGTAEAEQENAMREADLAKLSPEEQRKMLLEANTDARLKLYDLFKRIELQKFSQKLQTNQETDAMVRAGLDKDRARLQAILAGTEKQMAENSVEPPAQDWGISPQEEQEARARNAKYLQMAITQTRQVVDRVKFDTPVAAAIVTERQNVIEKAIKADAAAAPSKAKASKEYKGPKTKKITSPAALQAFAKLCDFLQTAWYSGKMDPNALSTRALRMLDEIASAQGEGICSKMVADKKALLGRKYAQVLGRAPGTDHLVKYSLVKRGPNAVERHLQSKPWDQLNPDELQMVLDEYYGITREASPAEQATPTFRIAGVFVTAVNREIKLKMDVDVVKKASQIARMQPDPVSDKPPKKKVKAGGLSKKPRKTRKPRKKRSKRKAKAPKAAKKSKSPPKTALQKWHRQKKNPGKMTL